MNARRDSYELLEQIGELIEGSLSPSAANELQVRLRTDAAARRLYVRSMMLETNLEWTKKERAPLLDFMSTTTIPVFPLASAHAPHELRLRSQPSRWSAPRLIGWAASILLVGYFVSMIGLLATDRLRRAEDHKLIADQPTEAVLALLTHADDASWKTSADAAAMPGALPRTLQVRSGKAELKFAHGASVVLEGPADFEVRSAAEGFLRQGKLIASVPHKAVGFVISTPSAQIVDLGTEFGVEVGTSGDTDVHVIRGAVEVDRIQSTTTNNLSSTKKRLVAGNAVRVNRSGVSEISAISVAKGTAIGQAAEPLQLDLVDIVAGGDGRGHRRNLGIDPTNGRVVYVPDNDFTVFNYFPSAGYRQPDDRPFIDGVGILDSDQGPVQLTSARHTFASFPKTDGKAYGPIWAGGKMPEHSARETLNTKFDDRIDYASPPNGYLTMYTNKLITFDLAAIRKAYPKQVPSAVRTTIGMTKPINPISAKAAAWIFVDGELKHRRSEICVQDPPEDVDVPIAPTAQFLTFASTDGEDSPHFDWLIFANPVLVLNPNERP
jgi:hypothetical protein